MKSIEQFINDAKPLGTFVSEAEKLTGLTMVTEETGFHFKAIKGETPEENNPETKKAAEKLKSHGFNVELKGAKYLTGYVKLKPVDSQGLKRKFLKK